MLGRAGYLGCLVLLGVIVLGISCLAVFGATGAINANRGVTVAQAEPPGQSARAGAQAASEPTRSDLVAKSDSPGTVAPTRIASITVAGASSPIPAGTIVPTPRRVGPEESISQKLEISSVGGGLKLTALGVARTKTTNGSILAIYVRLENIATAPIRVDPAQFKLVDRTGARYRPSKEVSTTLAAIELSPSAAPGSAGKNTEGNLIFEVPSATGTLALTYDVLDAPPLRVALPPEFG